MNPLTVANLTIGILREVMAEIDLRVKRGEIPVDAQEAQLRKIDMLRTGQFVGPEWNLEPELRPTPPKPDGV